MSDRHVDHRPTKEVFYDVMVGTAISWVFVGGHYGALIDHDDDYGAIQVYVPHDFAAVEELALRVIPNLAAPAMTFTVMCGYGRKDELALTGGNVITYSFGPTQAGLAANARIREVDIKLSVADGARSLRAGDQLGLLVSRVAGQNTNLYLLGARFKYKYQ